MATESKLAAPKKHASENSEFRATLFMVLLSLQFGLQPLLFKECIDRKNVTLSSMVFGQELMKLGIAVVMLIFDPTTIVEELRRFRLRESLKFAALPALIYAVQNLLTQVGYQNLDFLTFNLLNQTKILFMAFFIYQLMGIRQSHMQVLALAVLFVAAVLLCSEPKNPNSNDEDDIHNDFWLGVIPVLGASLMSGLAGGLSQVALQRSKRNSYLYTMEIATYSIISLSALIFIYPEGFDKDREAMLTRGVFGGWTRMTSLPVFTNAMGGIFVGQVTKYGGGVKKGFATIFGILITTFLQSFIYNKSISVMTWVAIPLVITSICLHSMFPARHPHPPHPHLKKS